jgi:lipopolysaccharide export system protein LptC
MHKTLILALVVLALTAWLAAQPNDVQSETAQSADKATGQPMLEGCLQSQMGHYYLFDKDGEQHRLSGAANKLRHYVKHEIQVLGEPGIETVDMTDQSGASSAAEIKVFKVSGVKELSKTCQTAAQ